MKCYKKGNKLLRMEEKRMYTQHRNKRRFLFTAVLFLLMFSCMTVQAEGKWKKNSNGTYSYYEDGKIVKKKWIKTEEGTYYVNSNGLRQTGWLYKGKKWYYFSKSGLLLKDKWIKYKKNLYYAGEDGALYVNGMHQVRGKYTYAFSSRGVVLKGRRTYKKKTYYFASANGRMVTNKWIKTNGQYYYYGETGAMAKSQWVGRYYVGKAGTRLKSAWQDGCYLGSNGKAYVGLHKIGKYYYYFDSTTYKKTVSTTITVKGKTYKFNSAGRGTLIATNNVPTPSVEVEDTYYTDPVVDDETLLAAIIYAEAGNQSYTGKVAVGIVIMNRIHSSLFPDKLRELIYQKQQFQPARDGALTKSLTYPSLVDEKSKKAAKTVLERFQNYTTGTKIYINIDGEKELFPYLFFMTYPSYQRLKLTDEYVKIGDHVFFMYWK